MDLAPAAAISAAASSARSRSTSATATAPPAAASPLVIARPIPAASADDQGVLTGQRLLRIVHHEDIFPDSLRALLVGRKRRPVRIDVRPSVGSRAEQLPAFLAGGLVLVLGFDQGGFSAPTWVWGAAPLAIAAAPSLSGRRSGRRP